MMSSSYSSCSSFSQWKIGDRIRFLSELSYSSYSFNLWIDYVTITSISEVNSSHISFRCSFTFLPDCPSEVSSYVLGGMWIYFLTISDFSRCVNLGSIAYKLDLI